MKKTAEAARRSPRVVRMENGSEAIFLRLVTRASADEPSVTPMRRTGEERRGGENVAREEAHAGDMGEISPRKTEMNWNKKSLEKASRCILPIESWPICAAKTVQRAGRNTRKRTSASVGSNALRKATAASGIDSIAGRSLGYLGEEGRGGEEGGEEEV